MKDRPQKALKTCFKLSPKSHIFRYSTYIFPHSGLQWKRSGELTLVSSISRALGRGLRSQQKCNITTLSKINLAKARDSRKIDARFNGPRKDDVTPLILPYTTSASEFVYGFSAVVAALKAQRRKLYQLYLLNDQQKERKSLIPSLANAAGVEYRYIGRNWQRLLDAASSGRPHNGIILEASPLPKRPLIGLGTTSKSEQCFDFTLDSQSPEERVINGNQTLLKYQSNGWRFPLVFYLDCIKDEGNMGAVLRSLYFLGADAVIISERDSAPLSAITVKASAGAAEVIPIFTTNDASALLRESSSNGWKIFGANTPKPLSARTSSFVTDPTVAFFSRQNEPISLESPLSKYPCLVMLGSEGDGIKRSLKMLVDYWVGVHSGRSIRDIDLDSLNVSVAAAMVCSEFLKRPTPQRKADLF